MDPVGMKRLDMVVGQPDVGRSVVLDDLVTAWQEQDRHRVVPVQRFDYSDSRSKAQSRQFERETKMLVRLEKERKNDRTRAKNEKERMK